MLGLVPRDKPLTGLVLDATKARVCVHAMHVMGHGSAHSRQQRDVRVHGEFWSLGSFRKLSSTR